MKRELYKMTADEFADLVPKRINSCILPIGTIEAHGVLPLGTDTIIPERFAQILAERLNLLIAPPIYYGITRSLIAHPGSMTVTPKTFEKYSYEVLTALINIGFHNVVIINGHGGHFEELKRNAYKLYQKKRARTITVHWWILCQDITEKIYGSRGGHAAVDETAAILATEPATVQKSRYRPDQAYLDKAGLMPHPHPSRMVVYEAGSPELDFNEDKAKGYFTACTNKLAEEITRVFRLWQASGV